MTTEYDDVFYNSITGGSIDSAEVIAPLIFEAYRPDTLVDVGCGRGVWGKKFADMGVEVLGIDGEYVKDPVIPFMAHDLTEPVPDIGRFDMAICLEVAEHLNLVHSIRLIEDLTKLADVVVFSAAIPFQTGTGHINCQWQSFWAGQFGRYGYGVWDFIRPLTWNNGKVEPWYRQNMLVYQKGLEYTRPMDMVHPDIHYWGRTW